MKLETFKQPTTEVFVTGHDISVTCNPWANHEGVSVMIHGKDLTMRAAFALRWEEAQVLMLALTAAQA